MPSHTTEADSYYVGEVDYYTLSEYGRRRARAEDQLEAQRARRWTGDGTAPATEEPPAYQRRQVAALLTSLDAKETSGFGGPLYPSPERPNPQSAKALSLWTYATSDRERKVAHEVGGCGTQLWVALDDEGPCTIRNRCKHRACPQCCNYRGKQIADALTIMMNAWPRTKFVTLTRKPRDASLRDQVKSLLHDFNTLRRTALWKASVGQGAYTVEITRAVTRGHWHVHIHILCHSTYIPQVALSDSWKKVTRDSGIVHIRAAKPSDAQYLAKYVAKANTSQIHEWEQWAFNNELAGVRLCGTFGGAPSFTALKPDPNHTLIAPLEAVQAWAMNGDVWAQDLLELITARLLSKPTRDQPPEPGGSQNEMRVLRQ